MTALPHIVKCCLDKIRRGALYAFQPLDLFLKKARESDPETQPISHVSRIYWNDLDKHTLKHLVHETETKASGRVQVVSLVDFRSSIGELWEKYQERIVMITDSTISRMIGKGNTFIAQDDDTWILLFPELSEDQAQDLTDSIASAIGDKLMGAKFTPHEAPFPSTAKLNFSRAIKSDGSVNVDALRDEISKVRAAQESSSTGKQVEPPNKPESSDQAKGTKTIKRRTNFARLNTLLIPSWSADTECVDSFFFRAYTESGLNIFQFREDLQVNYDVIDLFGRAATAFQDLLKTRLKAKFTIPLPFSVLRGPSLEHFHKLIASFPQRQRLLQLRLEVTNIPETAGAADLVGIRERFRPFVRDVAFLTDPLSPNNQVLALDHIVVGGEVTNGSDFGEDDLFQALLHFRQAANQRTTFVLGLDSKSKIGTAIRAGINEIGGHGLVEAQRCLPAELAVISRQDLLSNY